MQLDNFHKIFISVQVAQALTYLHTASPPLVHYDVKPGNILVSVVLLCCI